MDVEGGWHVVLGQDSGNLVLCEDVGEVGFVSIRQLMKLLVIMEENVVGLWFLSIMSLGFLLERVTVKRGAFLAVTIAIRIRSHRERFRDYKWLKVLQLHYWQLLGVLEVKLHEEIFF